MPDLDRITRFDMATKDYRPDRLPIDQAGLVSEVPQPKLSRDGLFGAGPSGQLRFFPPNGIASKLAGLLLDKGPVDVDYFAADLAPAIRRLTVGSRYGSTVHDLVETVIENANGRPLGRVTINGHGSAGIQAVGYEEIGFPLSPLARTELVRLKGLFDEKSGELILHGCGVGAGPAGEYLLAELSQLIGVKVSAATGYQFPLLGRILFGSTVTATPTPDRMANISVDDSPIDGLMAILPNKVRKYWGDASSPALIAKFNSMLDLMELQLPFQILDEFESIRNPDTRRHMYRWIENHPWQGKLVASGPYRDELHKLLNVEQRNRLEVLLNLSTASE